ncbi:unnamed protein product [Jaminaea pallidilutea]
MSTSQRTSFAPRPLLAITADAHNEAPLCWVGDANGGSFMQKRLRSQEEINEALSTAGHDMGEGIPANALSSMPDWQRVGVAARRLRRYLHTLGEQIPQLMIALRGQGDDEEQRQRVLHALQVLRATAREQIDGLEEAVACDPGEEGSSKGEKHFTAVLSDTINSVKDRHAHVGNSGIDSDEDDDGDDDSSIFTDSSHSSDYTLPGDSRHEDMDEDVEMLDTSRTADGEMSIYQLLVISLQANGHIYTGKDQVKKECLDYDGNQLRADVFDRVYLPRFLKCWTYLFRTIDDGKDKGEFMPDLAHRSDLRWPGGIHASKLADLEWATGELRGHAGALVAFVLEIPPSDWRKDKHRLSQYVELIGWSPTLYDALAKIILVCQPASNLPSAVRSL